MLESQVITDILPFQFFFLTFKRLIPKIVNSIKIIFVVVITEMDI